MKQVTPKPNTAKWMNEAKTIARKTPIVCRELIAPTRISYCFQVSSITDWDMQMQTVKVKTFIWSLFFENTRNRKWSLLKEGQQCEKGLILVQALRGRVGAKGCWRIFFKNPTTQLRVVWGLREKKCEQTPKFACFSVWRRPLHIVHHVDFS